MDIINKDQQRELLVKETSDGSNTLYVPELDEHYHSSFGALQEAEHIFIKSALDYFTVERTVEAKCCDDITILEVGFGTGLNALLTAVYCSENSLNINYVAVEKFPVDQLLLDQLSYRSIDSLDLYSQISTPNWNREGTVLEDAVTTVVDGGVKLHKYSCDILKFNILPKGSVDIVYFDAFSPDTQPELWSVDLFRSLFESLTSGGILVTYCSKGIVKRALREVGFIVKRLEGPPGKRHILRATKL